MLKKEITIMVKTPKLKNNRGCLNCLIGIDKIKIGSTNIIFFKTKISSLILWWKMDQIIKYPKNIIAHLKIKVFLILVNWAFLKTKGDNIAKMISNILGTILITLSNGTVKHNRLNANR